MRGEEEDRDTKRCGKVSKRKAVTHGRSFGSREINETALSALDGQDFLRKCSCSFAGLKKKNHF